MIKRLLTLLCMQLAFCCTIFAANYLTFTAEKDSSAFSIEDHDIKSNIFYSLDNGKTWNKLTDQPVKLAKGDRALLKGGKPDEMPSWRNYSNFKMAGTIAASGSVMSLVDGNGEGKTIPYAYCFCRLFQDCTSLTKAPELPATTLAERCYDKMFFFCFRLTQAPELPAKTLAERCYKEMFRGCSNLTKAPELPTKTLAVKCYYDMFSGCTSLTQAPELPATTLARACYIGMFRDCTSLTQAPELPTTTLEEDCYGWMFSGCTSMTKAPELPAKTLANGCYAGMFNGCSNLAYIDVKFTDWGTDTFFWLRGVAENGTFLCPAELSTDYYGGSRIPENWEIRKWIHGTP